MTASALDASALAFLRVADRLAPTYGAPTYAELAAAGQQVQDERDAAHAARLAAEARCAELYAALRSAVIAHAAAEFLLRDEDPNLDVAYASARDAMIKGVDALRLFDARADIAKQPGVAVLAAERDRRRVAGHRP